MLEKLGRGEVALVHSDQVGPYDDEDHRETCPASETLSSASPLAKSLKKDLFEQLVQPVRRFSRLAITGTCAALILIPLLYVVELALPGQVAEPEVALVIPETGDQVAGYRVTDHFRIRPVHPVTGGGGGGGGEECSP